MLFKKRFYLFFFINYIKFLNILSGKYNNFFFQKIEKKKFFFPLENVCNYVIYKNKVGTSLEFHVPEWGDSSKVEEISKCKSICNNHNACK